ncbi:TaqI-like C-terminal specificity domain-containing protein [Pontiellaceae bacterium B1224]|nr:TaqI-like C-terminal specificity domain-containing protein [Pontiellaceae bacterium B1224]
MQMSLPIVDLSEAVEDLASGSEVDRGAIFTRREVVDFMLDLAGYTTDQPLHTFRVLEPSFGGGDFLIPIVERLLLSYLGHNLRDDLTPAIRAVEIHRDSVVATRSKLAHLLSQHGLTQADQKIILDSWLIKGDFLLTELSGRFTHAIGNPPYVRQEAIPTELLAEYRSRYSTIYDRADLYVPFIEKCLSHLSTNGALAFICADRWMKNKYGGPLRRMVSEQFHLACYVDMVDTQAFHSEVSAYPAITLIKRVKSGTTRIACKPDINKAALTKLAAQLRDGTDDDSVFEIRNVAQRNEPWILKLFPQLAVARRLEADFPSLEEANCKVGIGVATGADKIYIGDFQSMEVEPDRKLPLIKTADIKTGKIDWLGHGVINPFTEDGSLVNLEEYPLLAAYLEKHVNAIKRRNCAQRNPNNWYRTIDRITPTLMKKPKLLIPDIKGDAHVVLDEGHFYPHHNLYYITSDDWNLSALKKVLESGIARLFVSLYSTSMRGGFLRFQAQYIRRIRLPKWCDVPEHIKTTLVKESSQTICTEAVFELYRLSTKEREAIEIQP